MKASLKQFVYEELNKGRYLTDSDIFGFRKREEDIITATTYKQNWERLNRDREWFKDKDISKLHNYKRNYMAQIRGYDFWTKICKEYFEEIKHEFKRDLTREDLKKNVFGYYK